MANAYKIENILIKKLSKTIKPEFYEYNLDI